MAFVSDIRSSGFSISTRIANLRANVADRRARRQIYVQTKRELESLTRRELDDIGISAGDINRIAMEASIR